MTASRSLTLALCALLLGCPPVLPVVEDAGSGGRGGMTGSGGAAGGGGGGGTGGVGGHGDGGCPLGEIVCGEFCFNPLVDNANCGFCGRTCGSNEACGGGQCLLRDCRDSDCGPGQVCVNGTTCTDQRCVGVSCAMGSTCVAGQCQLERCGTTPCAPGSTCVNGACVDVACGNVVCPPGITCARGVCGGGSAPVGGTLSSGGSLGASNMSNGTHFNSGILGEATPPTNDVLQTNGRQTHHGGFGPLLRSP